MNQKRSEKDEMKQEIERVNKMAAGLRNHFSTQPVGSEEKPSLSKATLPEDANDSAETEEESVASYYKKHPIAQEQHHATHALWFLFFLSRLTLKGERARRRTIARIIHHLMDLREFLEEGELTDCVNSLYLTLQVEYNQSLGIFVRGIHNGVRAIVRKMGIREGDRTFSNMNSVLIATSEGEKQPIICMYSWLVANQGKVLNFARHYGKEHVFQGLIPIKIDNGSMK